MTDIERIAINIAHGMKETLMRQRTFIRGLDNMDDEKNCLIEEVRALRRENAELHRKIAAMAQVIEGLMRELSE